MGKINFAKLEKVYANWTDDELVKAATVDKSDYDPKAVEVILQILTKRGILGDQLNSIRDKLDQNEKNDIRRLSGIGGFLILFLLSLAIGSIFSIISGVLNFTHMEEMPILTFADSVPSILMGFWGMYIVNLFANTKKSAPSYAIKWLTTNIFLSLFFIALSLYYGSKFPLRNIIAISISLIWIKYFSISQRVKATYGAPQTKTEPPPSDQPKACDTSDSQPNQIKPAYRCVDCFSIYAAEQIEPNELFCSCGGRLEAVSGERV